MKANLEFLKDRFHRYNHEIFSGKLPEPIFHVTAAGSFVGQYKVKRVGRHSLSEERHLTLSDRYDLPETQLEDIVIHEMIHYYIHHSKLRDTSSHGQIFRKMMHDINMRFRRHITVSHRCTKEEYESDTAKVHSIICLCTMTDGRKLICKASQSKIFELHKAFQEWDKVAKEEWYWVYSSYFNRYRRVLTPKLFEVDTEGLNLIESSTRLEFAVESDGRLILRRASPMRR